MGKLRIEKNNTAKQWKKVKFRVISHIRVLHQDYGWRIADIHKLKYRNIAWRTTSYHTKIVTGKKKSKTDVRSARADQDCSMIDMVVA